MFEFHTGNSVYFVRDGRITRYSDAPIENLGSRVLSNDIVREPFTWDAPLAVGQRARFTLKRGNVPVSTSRVEEVVR